MRGSSFRSPGSPIAMPGAEPATEPASRARPGPIPAATPRAHQQRPVLVHEAEAAAQEPIAPGARERRKKRGLDIPEAVSQTGGVQGVEALRCEETTAAQPTSCRLDRRPIPR